MAETKLSPQAEAGISALDDALRSLLTGPHGSVYLQFNEHSINYESARQAFERGEFNEDDWISEEEFRRAVDFNSVWTAQWYPAGQVSFWKVSASRLAPLLEYVLQIGTRPAWRPSGVLVHALPKDAKHG